MYYPSRISIVFIFSCSIAFSIFQLNVFAKDRTKQNLISQLIPSELGDVEQFKQDFETRYIPSKNYIYGKAIGIYNGHCYERNE